MSAEHEMRDRVALQRAELLVLARRLVRQDDDAQDVVHDTLQAALEQPRAPRSLSAWLQQVLRNRVRGAHRRQSIQARTLTLVVEPEGSGDPVEWLEHRRWLDALRRALDEIAEPYRGVLIRRFFDGQSPLEIARADGDPPGTIRWRIHEGLRRLRARLDERHGEKAWGAALLAIPLSPESSPAPPGATTMSMSTTIKLALALGILAVPASLVALAPAVASGPAASTDATDVPPTDDAPGVPPTVAPSRAAAVLARNASEPASDPAIVQPDPEAAPTDAPAPANPIELIADAIDLCVDDLGAERWRGLPRLELDMYTWTLPGGETQIERIDLTTGRQLMCADDVDQSTPVDAPGVTRHDELADCLAYTLDLERFPPTRDELGRIAATTDHMHGPREVVLPLDAQGHVVRGDPEGDALGLPELDEDADTDPEGAVERFGLPVLGAPWETAKVRIVECGSYSCPFCRRSEQTVAAIRASRDDVAFAFLTMPIDAAGVRLATAAVAAERQGRAWEAHRALFRHRPSDREAVLALARSLELDVDRFARDLDDPQVQREVARRRRVCEAAGARATPTFFVNGDLLRGEVGETRMSAAIDAVMDDA